MLTFIFLSSIIAASSALIVAGTDKNNQILSWIGMAVMLSGVFFITWLGHAGYCVPIYHLPNDQIYEVVYVGPQADDEQTFVALIKIPKRGLRLFELDQPIKVGLVKVQADGSLQPLPPPPAEKPEVVP